MSQRWLRRHNVKAYLWIAVGMFLSGVVTMPSILLYLIAPSLPFLERILICLIAFVTQWMAMKGVFTFIFGRL